MTKKISKIVKKTTSDTPMTLERAATLLSHLFKYMGTLEDRVIELEHKNEQVTQK